MLSLGSKANAAPNEWACRAVGLDMPRLLVQWAVVVCGVATALIVQELAKRDRQENGPIPRPHSLGKEVPSQNLR
jgi:hypothetical protein